MTPQTKKILIISAIVVVLIIIGLIIYFQWKKKQTTAVTPTNALSRVEPTTTPKLDKIGDVATFDTTKYPISDVNFNMKVIADGNFAPTGAEIYARSPSSNYQNWYLVYDPDKNKFIIFGTKNPPDPQIVNKNDPAIIDVIKNNFTQFYGGKTYQDFNYKLILT